MPSIFNPKITMYKNIIKLAAIAAKDTPSAIMKKLRKHDPGFVQDRDLEIESYLSRKSSLSFGDFAVLLEDCYARYAIEEEFLAQYGDKYGLKADATLDEAMAAVNASEDGLLAQISE